MPSAGTLCPRCGEQHPEYECEFFDKDVNYYELAHKILRDDKASKVELVGDALKAADDYGRLDALVQVIMALKKLRRLHHAELGEGALRKALDLLFTEYVNNEVFRCRHCRGPHPSITCATTKPGFDLMSCGACWYSDPRELDRLDIDPLIWPIVEKINKCGWVWTAESCQGHPDATAPTWAGNTEPMLRLVFQRQDRGVVMDLLFDANREVGATEPKFPDDPNAQDFTVGCRTIKIHDCEPASDRWCEMLFYCAAKIVFSRDHGIKIFSAFADKLADSADSS